MQRRATEDWTEREIERERADGLIRFLVGERKKGGKLAWAGRLRLIVNGARGDGGSDEYRVRFKTRKER